MPIYLSYKLIYVVRTVNAYFCCRISYFSFSTYFQIHIDKNYLYNKKCFRDFFSKKNIDKLQF